MFESNLWCDNIKYANDYCIMSDEDKYICKTECCSPTDIEYHDKM